MASRVENAGSDPAAGELARLVAADGGAAHRWFARLLATHGDAKRDGADAAHFLCVLHGRHPGVIDHAAAQIDAAPWLAQLAEAFAGERAFVTRVAVASGPAPSTPGAAQAEAAVGGQAHALEMLARSERQGCAAGAALALALDWRALRPVLEIVAVRVGVDVPPLALPGADELPGLDDADDGATSRARLFGAEQLLAQHRGLMDLLEARAAARRTADGLPPL